MEFEKIENHKNNDKTNACGCFFLVVLIIFILLIDLIISYIYTKSNNAPVSCIFAKDTVTCVQISKKEKN